MNFAPFLFLLALPLAAQAPVGAWTLASAPNITAVIEAATAPMNFIKRPIARSRLGKTNPAYKRIHIDHTPAEFIIQYDDRAPQHMPTNGNAVNWKREDGETFLIAIRNDQGDLRQTYKAEDGERTNVFHVDPASGSLTLTVTISSTKLPGPVTYAITYRPEGR